MPITTRRGSKMDPGAEWATVVSWGAVALPSSRGRAPPHVRLALRKPLVEQPFQRSDVQSLFARTSCVTWAASFAHCRSKSISDRVNIRGVGEVPSFRVSKAIEGVAEVFLPPRFEVRPVLPSEFMESFLRRVQFGRVRLAGQADCADHQTSLLSRPSRAGSPACRPGRRSRPPSRAGVLVPRSRRTRLSGEPAVTVGSGVTDNIGLHDGGVVRDTQAFAQQFPQCPCPTMRGRSARTRPVGLPSTSPVAWEPRPPAAPAPNHNPTARSLPRRSDRSCQSILPRDRTTAYLARRCGRANTYIAFGAPGTRPPPTGMARYCLPSTA